MLLICIQPCFLHKLNLAVLYKFELSILIKFWFTMPMLHCLLALTILIVKHILYVVYKGTTMICQISDYFSCLLHEERIVVIPILN